MPRDCRCRGTGCRDCRGSHPDWHGCEEMPATYSESARGVTITRARAMQELRAHGIDTAAEVRDFLAEVGDSNTYAASDVLAWLGY